MPKGRTARGMVPLLMSQACFFVAGCVVTIVVPRGLGPENYGLYGIILAVLFWGNVYLAASQIARIPQLGVLAVSLVLLPSIARASGTNDMSRARRYVQEAVWFLLVVLLPLLVLTTIEAEEIMVLLYSSRYAGGGVFLGNLIFGYSLVAFLNTLLIILQAKGDQSISLGIGSGLVLVMLVLNVVLNPTFGPLGAAYAMATIIGVGTMIAGVFVYHRLKCALLPWGILKVIGATTCMALVTAMVSLSGPLLLLLHIGLFAMYVVFSC